MVSMLSLDRLRPLTRRLRSHFKQQVFTVRRWTPDRPVDPPPVAGPLAYDVLWRTSKHRLVHVDAPFSSVEGYPIDSAGFVPLINVRPRGGDSYLSITYCSRTGLVFHRLLPSPEWQHRYYASDWDRAQEAAPDAAAILRKRPEKVGAILRGRIKPGLRVLDVGCGYGDQLFYLQKRGCAVTGLEPSQHRARFAAEQFGLRVINGPIDGHDVSASFDGRTFDLIYLNQVLEHLPDPLRVLRALRPLLAPGGRLLTGVPDLFQESLASFGGEITHTHSFSASALRNVAALAGYRTAEDLSFPGYVYVLFEAAGTAPALEDPQTAKVLKYLLAHFGLGDSAPKTGDTISISSSYTGTTDLGLRVTSAPAAADWRAFRSAARSGNVAAVREHLPVTLTMPFDHPVLWMK